MILSQIDHNLLLLLDPLGDITMDNWHFASHPEWTKLNSPALGSKNRVYCFGRKQLLEYLLFSLVIWLVISRNRYEKIFYVHEGLMSALFPPSFSREYRKFSENTLCSSKISILPWLKSFLPLALKSEHKYVILWKREENVFHSTTNPLTGFEFMFFSNPSGKLLLTNRKTLLEGRGQVAKTTATHCYIGKILKEAATVSRISEFPVMKGKVPCIINSIKLSNRHFVVEEYFGGKNLREILRSPKVCRNPILIKEYINQLDNWFATYRSIFSGDRISMIELYRALFEISKKCYQDDQNLMALVHDIENELANVTKNHPGLVPIIAHNDLWPGNFLVDGMELVAIDWERAAPNRCELFDYFWMIISATLEYAIGIGCPEDYSLCFRYVVSGSDQICKYVFDKLVEYLCGIGFNNKFMDLFMRLFLLEWSLQGEIALGRRTAMDDIALKELINYECSSN